MRLGTQPGDSWDVCSVGHRIPAIGDRDRGVIAAVIAVCQIPSILRGTLGKLAWGTPAARIQTLTVSENFPARTQTPGALDLRRSPQ
jgi:hypothetical protein